MFLTESKMVKKLHEVLLNAKYGSIPCIVAARRARIPALPEKA